MNQEHIRQKEYNCRKCRKEGKIDKRICYWFQGESHDLTPRMQIEDENGQPILVRDKVLPDMDIPALVDVLIEITDTYPTLSPLEALRNCFPSVCPKSLINEQIDMLLAMESFCKEYGLKPLGEVGYLDYPCVFVDVFSAICAARDRYQMKQMQEMKSKQ